MADRIARIWTGTEWEVISSPVFLPNSVATFQATAPSSPVTGQLWIDQDDNKWYFWNGSSWVASDTLPSQTGNSGEFLITNGTTSSWSNTITANSNSAVALIAKGVASQTANLQEWQNSSSTIVASISNTGAFTATTKSFDIEHPTKEGMRLRYGSLEGPENGVYIRGKSSSSEIALPDYWMGLVDEDSVTIQLTPIKIHQNLYVEDIQDNKVFVGGVEWEYFYFIQAERKDVDKLMVEY